MLRVTYGIIHGAKPGEGFFKKKKKPREGNAQISNVSYLSYSHRSNQPPMIPFVTLLCFHGTRMGLAEELEVRSLNLLTFWPSPLYNLYSLPTQISQSLRVRITPPLTLQHPPCSPLHSHQCPTLMENLSTVPPQEEVRL